MPGALNGYDLAWRTLGAQMRLSLSYRVASVQIAGKCHRVVASWKSQLILESSLPNYVVHSA